MRKKQAKVRVIQRRQGERLRKWEDKEAKKEEDREWNWLREREVDRGRGEREIGGYFNIYFYI